MVNEPCYVCALNHVKHASEPLGHRTHLSQMKIRGSLDKDMIKVKAIIKG